MVGFKVDVDSLGVSTLMIISCSLADWESDLSASLESDSASSRSQSLCNMSVCKKLCCVGSFYRQVCLEGGLLAWSEHI